MENLILVNPWLKIKFLELHSLEMIPKLFRLKVNSDKLLIRS